MYTNFTFSCSIQIDIFKQSIGFHVWHETIPSKTCELACLLEILHDIITPDIEQLERIESFSPTAGNFFLKSGSFPALYKAIAQADELPEECAEVTVVESKCSFKPTSKLSTQSLALISTTLMRYSSMVDLLKKISKLEENLN